MNKKNIGKLPNEKTTLAKFSFRILILMTRGVRVILTPDSTVWERHLK